MKGKKIFFYMISFLGLIIPIGYLLKLISEKIAFPLVFFIMGLQQLFRVYFIKLSDKKTDKIFGLVFGIFFIAFGIFMAMTYFYR